MRVLVLSNLYPPNALGGYELSCRDVVDRWRARGHAVTVLTTATTVTGVVERPSVQPHVRRELEWYWADHAFLRPSPMTRWRLERHNAAALRRALHDARPDVVSVWHMGGMSLSLLTALEQTGVPVVLNVCDDWPVYGPQVDAWLSAWDRRPPVVRRLGAVLSQVPTAMPELDEHRTAFVSDFTRDAVRARSRWSLPRATVVGSGVDPVDFPVTDAAVRPWRGRLLGVGRLEPRKGFDTAVRALALLPGTRLDLVGVADSEHLAQLLALADELGVRDRLRVDAVPRAQLAARYAAADALLFLPRWDEPFGLVPLEGMTQGVPVVATRRGGSAEFLEDAVNCLAVPPDDPEAVAAAVSKLADDPALRQQLAEGGRATAARFSVDRLANVLEDWHAGAMAPVTVEPTDEARSATWAASSRVTVVVSTHGRSGYLEGLLERLDRQDLTGFDVVICDNGSEDGTWAVLQQWTARTAVPALALRLPFQPGPAVPRNTAVTRTRAPLLAFTDDDCLPVDSWLQSLTAPLEDRAVTVAQGRTRPETGGWGGPWGRSLTVESATGLFETANLACRRSDFLAVGGFPARRLLSGRAFGEDVLLGSALAARGRTAVAPGALVEHRVLPGSYRDFLRERHRMGGFPHLVRAVPALRDQAVAGVFLSPRTLAVDAGLLGLVAAVACRRALPALALLPWARECWRLAEHRPGRPRAVRAAQVGVGDIIGLAGLVEGSARARRLLL